MNIEQVEKFILYTLEETKKASKLSFNFLPINIILLIISGFIQSSSFIWKVVIVLILFNIILSIIYLLKWSYTIGILSQITHVIILFLSLDFIIYGIYNHTNLHIFLIIILLQVILIILNLFFSKKIIINVINRYEKNKVNINRNIVMSGTSAVLSYLVIRFLAKTIDNNVSSSVLLLITTILFNILIYFLSIPIILDVFKIYFVKKYKLNIKI